ncbi:nuclear transport factor 2 family protein [Xenorhabdus stockiae]|uniref:nuclear transport factor 2 family protein n=1 Tax=Xenorhabdus stockiae TaxID=351614 RepID=UPI004062813F
MSYSTVVVSALKYMLETDNVTTSDIESYFSHDYIQVANGNELLFDDFVSHINVLKEALISTNINILSVAENGNNVHTHHRVKVVKKDGTNAEFEVFARFQLSEGKITHCYELTRKIIGDEQDDDLGYRK